MSEAGKSIPFDRVAGTYEKTRGGLERGRALSDRLLDLLASDAPVLEVGVGTAAIAAALAERGRTVLGVDLSLPMLAVARDRLPGRVAAGDALRLPVRSGSVGSVVIVHVVHLVAAVPPVIAEAARVLRPGGTLAATAFPGRAQGDLFDLLHEIQDHLTGPRPPEVDAPMVTAIAADLGLELVDHSREPDFLYTPAEAATALESRTASWMWAVDEDRWTRDVPPLLDRLRSLPEQDTPRRAHGAALLAFRR